MIANASDGSEGLSALIAAAYSQRTQIVKEESAALSA
jgi:hypothetical protein